MKSNLVSTARRYRPHRPRRAIILLVVLGMLALFSLLTATYIVFTSRARQASADIGRRETRRIDGQVLIDQAMGQVLRGTTNTDSSLRGHSLLEDLYGTDSIIGKVLDTNSQDPNGVPPANSAYPYIPNARFGPEVMFGRGGATRKAQFLKVPVQVGSIITNPNDAFPIPYNIEDSLLGRYLVFSSGPLSGLSFEIMRSYGNLPLTDDAVANRNSVVLDLGPHLEKSITIGTVTEPLRNWLPTNLAAAPQLTGASRGLVYTAPAFVSGHQFRITARPRNGRGYGWASVGGTFNLNETFSPDTLQVGGSANGAFASASIPVTFQGNHRFYSHPSNPLPAGDSDEPLDLADYHDYLLGYFPPESSAPMVGLTAPSGIRPAMLNYLLHTFTTSGNVNPASWTVPQRLSMLRMLQRASLRPIPVVNGGALDISSGQYANFTGSNTSPEDDLRRPIDVTVLQLNNATGINEARHLYRMFLALIFGPAGADLNNDGVADTFWAWDVDNDGDGIGDSVWVDAGMGMLTMPDGTLVRPMVAVRIEDLDNRLDVNVVDSAASVATTGSGVTNLSRSNQFASVFAGLGMGGTASNLFSGFGASPAEIVLQSVFRQDRAARVITSRYGSDFSPGVGSSTPSQAIFPYPFSAGNDTLSVWGAMGRTPVHNVALTDLLDGSGASLGKQPYPNSTFGVPMDLHGRSLVGLDPYGQMVMPTFMSSGVPLPVSGEMATDASNNPQEMLYKNVSGVDFAHSTSELEPVLRYRDWDRNEQPGRLRQLVEEELAVDESSSTPLPSVTRSADDNYISRATLTHAVTTISATDASPSMSLPQEFSTVAAVSTQQFEPATRLALNILIDSTGGELPSDPMYESLIAPEFRRGERLNLNRPLGNGLNEENTSLNVAQRVPPIGNFTVDDPLELAAATDALFSPPVSNPNRTLGDFAPQTGRLPYGSAPALDPDALAPSATWPASAIAQKMQNDQSRAELARHLYAMTMLLIAKRGAGATYDAYDFRADPTKGDEERTRARRIAQWAVNVVDFRDRDAIMTRFQYDINPYDGWGNDPLEMDVVWGFENPELLLTESFNLHDRRSIDSDRDNGDGETRFDGSNFVDNDLDQARIPQGSTYLELYCVRGPKAYGNESDSHLAPPPELYHSVPRVLLDDNPGNDSLNAPDVVPILHLGRLAPDGNPVWRIGISNRPSDPNLTPDRKLATMNETTWDDLTFTPERLLSYQQSGINAGNPLPTDPLDPQWHQIRPFGRIIWFANQPPSAVGQNLPTDTRISSTKWGEPTTNTDIYRVYYNRFAGNDYLAGIVAGLQGGQYAMVGPRRRTYVGAQNYSSATGPLTFDNFYTRQYFDLHPFKQTDYAPGFQAYVPNNVGGVLETKLITPTPITSARQIVPILAAAEPPRNWSDTINTAPNGIGISISEPLPLALGSARYYQEPTRYLKSNDVTDNLNLLGFAKDSYFDYANLGAPDTLPDMPFDNAFQDNGTAVPTMAQDHNIPPLAFMNGTGTIDDFRTAYLQRLADPTSSYHPEFNPYITVDWLTMDLTVFNGEDNNDRQVGPGDGSVPDEWVDKRDEDPFDAGKNQFASRSRNGIGIDPQGNQRFAETDHIVWTYGSQPPTNSSQFNIPGVYTANYPMVVVHRDDWNGFFTGSGPASTSDNSFTMGYLNHAFGERFVPGIVDGTTEMWVGAPLNTPFPWLGFLNRDFASPLEVMMVPATSPDRLMLEFSIPGAAAPDPYGAKPGAATPDFQVKREFSHLLNFFSTSTDVQKAPNLYRIFDFIETPDTFIESKELLDPVRLRNPETARELDAMANYFPPLNFVTTEMRAGRVNLNTVNNPLVWRALMYLHGTSTERAANQPGAFWQEWMLSRRGYGTMAATSPALHRDVPTQFRGALQATDAGWIAPDVRNASLTLRRTGVQSGLLRKLTAIDGTQKTAFTRPSNTGAERDVRRNPFFRYQTLMRMPNLVSDNSNTFAVWLTVGLFEVDPSTLVIGQEYGIDQGTNQRFRSFYILDRSIPVNFIPGEESDSRKTIVLERRLN